MFEIKVHSIIFVFLYIFLHSEGLERRILEETDVILVTNSAIRNITNKLFIYLNLKGINHYPKIRQLVTVHNFLTSVTLKDHKTLNDIHRLSRTDNNNVKNETEHLIALVNTILNEDLHTTDDNTVVENDDLIQNVDNFLAQLKEFKENTGYNNNYENLAIKDEIIHILLNNKTDDYNDTKHDINVNEDLDNDVLLSENEFWVPQTRRIYQGTRTKIKYFPFAASVQIFNSFQCGGSIISSDLIVTAASCLQLAWNNRFYRENPAFLSVRIGSKFYNGGGDSISIMEVYFHPLYNPRNLHDNIALMRLRRHINFRKRKRRVKKIDIDRNNHPLPMNTDGITVVGWGARTRSNLISDPWSNQLAFAVLDVYGLQDCQDVYSKEYVTHRHFCAGFISKGGGACNHDVGGPGVVNGLLTGIISFGSPVCGTPDAPTVFTKVGYYADWMEEIMEMNVPHGKAQTTLKPFLMDLIAPPRLAHTTYKTFPLSSKSSGESQEPVRVIDADNLRMLEDENNFKEFLYTMFDSKEAKDYKEKILSSTDNEVVEEVDPVDEDFEDVESAGEGTSNKYESHQEDEVEHNILKSKTGIINGKYKIKTKKTELKKYDVPTPEIIEKTTNLMNEYDNTPDKSSEDESTIATTTDGLIDAVRSKKYTLVDSIPPDDDNNDESELDTDDIVKLIENIDLQSDHETNVEHNDVTQPILERIAHKNKKTVEAISEKISTKEIKRVESAQDKLVTKIVETVDQVTEKQKTDIRKQEEDVLTLLYISKEEKNGTNLETIKEAIEDFDANIGEGMSISVEGFKNISFRNNMSSAVVDFMSNNDFYNLLSEAIKEMTNKTET